MNKDYATNKELIDTKEELLDKLVSKKDFQNEIDKLVTKKHFQNEINKLVTKKDFQNEIDKLVTKKDFQREIKRVDGSIEMLGNQVGENTLEIQKLRGEMNDKFNLVLTAIDGLSGQISDSRTDKAASEHTFRRHEQRLDDHDKRIKGIEARGG